MGSLKENGLLVVNSLRDQEEIMASFPVPGADLNQYRKIRLRVIDATWVALKQMNKSARGSNPGPDQ